MSVIKFSLFAIASVCSLVCDLSAASGDTTGPAPRNVEVGHYSQTLSEIFIGPQKFEIEYDFNFDEGPLFVPTQFRVKTSGGCYQNPGGGGCGPDLYQDIPAVSHLSPIVVEGTLKEIDPRTNQVIRIVESKRFQMPSSFEFDVNLNVPGIVQPDGLIYYPINKGDRFSANQLRFCYNNNHVLSQYESESFKNCLDDFEFVGADNQTYVIGLGSQYTVPIVTPSYVVDQIDPLNKQIRVVPGPLSFNARTKCVRECAVNVFRKDPEGIPRE